MLKSKETKHLIMKISYKNTLTQPSPDIITPQKPFKTHKTPTVYQFKFHKDYI